MKVPTYQEQVTTKESPELRPVSQPSPSMPRAVPGAFGADVGQAYERLGQAGSKIASHLQALALEEQDKNVISRDTAFRQDIQNILLNGDDETVLVNGQNVVRKKGLLLRQLSQAKGITENFDEAYLKRVRNQYLSGLSKYETDKLGPAMDRYYVSMRDNIITHEANQLDEDFKDRTESNLKQRILDASAIRDTKSLNMAIDEAVERSTPYFNRFDEDTKNLKLGEIKEDIISSSVVSTLQDTGNLEIAKGMLDSVKDKLAQSSYDKIKNTLDSGYNSLVAQKHKIDLENKVVNRYNTFADMLSGKVNWSNATAKINEVASQDPELAEAIQENIKKGGYQPETNEYGDAKNQAFMDVAKNIFNSKDSKTISDFLVNALSDNKNISRDRLAILVYTAKQFSDELNKPSGPGFWKSAFDLIVKTGGFSPAFTLFNTIMRAKAENAQGSKVVDIANEELVKQAEKDVAGFTVNAPSESDIQFTMKKHNLSREEVLKRLRLK